LIAEALEKNVSPDPFFGERYPELSKNNLVTGTPSQIY
jgi:hypothetical protein